MIVEKCPICGKSFVPAPYHIYKASIKGRVKNLCGWNCLRKLERERETNKKPKEEKQNADR